MTSWSAPIGVRLMIDEVLPAPHHDGEVFLVDLGVLQEHHLERYILAAHLVTAKDHLAEGALAYMTRVC